MISGANESVIHCKYITVLFDTVKNGSAVHTKCVMSPTEGGLLNVYYFKCEWVYITGGSSGCES